MYLKKTAVGDIQTNCYIAGADSSDKCIIIDPGDWGENIFKLIQMDGRVPEAILLTHGHFDHIGAVNAVRTKYNIKVIAGVREENTLANPSVNLSEAHGGNISEKADRYVHDNEHIEYAGLRIKVIETPGHTIGSVCYYCEEDKVLFSGDTLFEGSVGRTDFPTGSSNMLAYSITKKLYLLPDDVMVYTGHGGATSIGFEKNNNMYYRIKI